MPNMVLSPRVMAMESVVLAERMVLPLGHYRAWMADEWMVLPLDEASQLLWPRLKHSERIIDEDAPAACAEWKNITAKAWHVSGDKLGVHVLLEVAREDT